MQDLIFDLESPLKTQLKIDGKNDFADLDKLYLVAPTYKQRDLTIAVKKMYFEALFAMTSTVKREEAAEKVDGDKQMDEKAISMVLLMAKDFDLVKFHNQFSKLLLEVTFKDEEKTQKLNSLDLQKLEENDFEKLVSKYIAFFLMSSWMKAIS